MTIIVVAGGTGQRLGGVKKALLEVGGRPLIERVLEATRPLGNEVVVVDNDASLAHLQVVRIVPDLEPGGGALAGLYSGMLAAGNPLSLAVGCDMPFLSSGLLRRLVELAPEHDVVIPVAEGQLHTLHAVYRRETCLGPIAQALARNTRRMTSFLGEVRVREVEEAELRDIDPDLRSLFNVNTPEDLARARAMVTHGMG